MGVRRERSTDDPGALTWIKLGNGLVVLALLVGGAVALLAYGRLYLGTAGIALGLVLLPGVFYPRVNLLGRLVDLGLDLW